MVKLKLATADQLDMADKAVSDAQLTKEMYEKQGSTTSEILEDGCGRPGTHHKVLYFSLRSLCGAPQWLRAGAGSLIPVE
jgi:hypothetical protein